MKIMVAVLLVCFAASVGVSQKQTLGKKEGFSSKAPAYKSMNSEAVAAALNTHSTSASQLAQIERQGVKPSSARIPGRSAAAVTPKTAPAAQGKNRTIRFSYKAPHTGVGAGK